MVIGRYKKEIFDFIGAYGDYPGTPIVYPSVRTSESYTVVGNVAVATPKVKETLAIEEKKVAEKLEPVKIIPVKPIIDVVEDKPVLESLNKVNESSLDYFYAELHKQMGEYDEAVLALKKAGYKYTWNDSKAYVYATEIQRNLIEIISITSQHIESILKKIEKIETL